MSHPLQRSLIWLAAMLGVSGLLASFTVLGLVVMQGDMKFISAIAMLFVFAFWTYGAVFVLREEYRTELANAKGRWQLSLSELVIIAWMTGFLMLIVQACLPRYALVGGIPMAIGLGICFAANLLLNARLGRELSYLKFLVAIGALLKIIGLLGILAIVIYGIMGNQKYFLERVFFDDHSNDWKFEGEGTYRLVRIGLLSLPTGWMLGWFGTNMQDAPERMHTVDEGTMKQLLKAKEASHGEGKKDEPADQK